LKTEGKLAEGGEGPTHSRKFHSDVTLRKDKKKGVRKHHERET